MVISQAWVHQDPTHADAYVRIASAFDDFLRGQPGFVSRRLVKSIDDPSHFVHLREWRAIEDYEAMTMLPAYQQHIAELSEHVDVARYTDGYPREFGEVVVSTDLIEFTPQAGNAGPSPLRGEA
jgi:heme-degrading monooxygenase HmoA